MDSEGWLITVCVLIVVVGVTTCSVSHDRKKSNKCLIEIKHVENDLAKCVDERLFLRKALAPVKEVE